MGKLIYHYTNPDVFLKILTNQEIWLTHFEYLNDSSEIIHAKDFFLKNYKNILKKLLKLDKAKELVNYLLDRSLKIHDLATIFIASFSSNGNSLNQWRAYCPNEGVSIGVDMDFIPGKINFYHKLECIYSEKKKYTEIKNLLESILLKSIQLVNDDKVSWESNWQDFLKYLDKIQDLIITVAEKQVEDVIYRKDFQKELQKIVIYISIKLLVLFSRFKDENFKDEKEIRIIRVLPIEEENKIEFRVKNNLIIPFTKVKLPREFIKRITVKPSHNSKLLINSIRNLTSKYRAKEIEIIESNIPLREFK